MVAATAPQVARKLGLGKKYRPLPKAPTRADGTMSRRQRLMILTESLMRERVSFDSHWAELADYIAPKRYRRSLSDANQGGKRQEKIVDSTATLAMRELQSWLMAVMASPSRPWFGFTVPMQEVDEDHDSQTWREGVRRDILRVFAESNFYTSLAMILGDESVFSNAAMSIVEDEDDIIRCYAYPVGSFAFGTYGTGRICVFVREFRKTVRQLVEEYGEESVTSGVLDLWKRGQTESWVDVCHAIVPNDEYEPGAKRTDRMEFREYYYEKCSPTDDKAEDKVLDESGYTMFPVIAARWELTGDDVYGTMGPGMIALPDIKQLMQMTKHGANAMAAVVKPPMQHPASLSSTQISLVPGDSTEVANTQDGNAIRPLITVDPHLADLQVYIENLRDRIRRCFFGHLMMGVTNDERETPPTATEINKREREALAVLGPVGERHNDDVFEPAIQLVYEILKNKRMIPEAPPSMQIALPDGTIDGVPLVIQYQSELAIAQRSVGLAGTERFLVTVMELAKMVPPILDNIDFDELAEDLAERNGVAPKIMRGEEDRAGVRESRAEADQQAQAMQAVPAAAKAARDLAAAPISEDNALGALASGLSEDAA